jgi:hypothetical protein
VAAILRRPAGGLRHAIAIAIVAVVVVFLAVFLVVGATRQSAGPTLPAGGARFAKRNPQTRVEESGALVHSMIERGSRDPVGTFVRAGYDAIDSGRDVRKLGGTGIRSKDAVFDPAQWNSENIMAAIAGLLGLPVLVDPSRE